MRYAGLHSAAYTLAVRTLAAIAVCLTLAVNSQPATGPDNKTVKKAARALRDGDFQQAEKLYRELLGKDPLDNDARLGLSYALLKQHRLQDAYDIAAEVVLSQPLSARAHALLGAALLASGNFRDSVDEFRTAISVQEDEPLAIAGLAMIDFYENRLELAMRGLRRASSLDPDEPDFIFSLGQAAARGERYKEAADAYERFLSVAPKTDADRRARIRGLVDFLRYLGKQKALYVPSGESRTAVSWEGIDHRPIIQVRVNGQKEPLRFVLDTGSGMSVISIETAQRLGLRPIARGGLARAVGGGGRFEIVYGFLSSMEIGDVKLANVPVYIRRFYGDRSVVDGYIGLSVLSKFIASVDYGQKTFALVRRGTPEPVKPEADKSPMPTGAVEIPLRTTSSGFLSGEVRLQGVEQPLNFIIDTGASISVVSEQLANHQEVSSYLQSTRMRVFGAAGISDNVKSLLLPKVMLGTFTLERISAAVLNLDPVNETSGFAQNGILGGNFLRHFRVSFDFSRGVIHLEPLNKTAKSGDSKPEEM